MKTFGVNQAKWKAAREYCKDRNMEFLILTEKSKRMSIFTDVKDLAEGKSQSKEWYRSQLQYGPYEGTFEVGDVISLHILQRLRNCSFTIDSQW